MWKRLVTNYQNIQSIWYELQGLLISQHCLPTSPSSMGATSLLGLCSSNEPKSAQLTCLGSFVPPRLLLVVLHHTGPVQQMLLSYSNQHYSALSCWCFGFCFHVPDKWMRLGWIHSLPFLAELPAVSEGWAVAVSLSQMWLPPPKQTSCHFPIEKPNEISRRFAVFMMHLFAFLPFFPFLFFNLFFVLSLFCLQFTPASCLLWI